ncbi:PIN domain-containing protein [Pseudomonas sp. B21-023]|uniref:PIN domain-containing protein n=1 Tax=Pseudomonas sp. B21-023 TaxID=2895477 RepID=UPI00215EDBC9|nr:PIN domain-containing protein [Pseudomonas sp. B21-023]UVM15617.1 PIN domain-containing protein [Pseudomonas sp. B21-023]
MRSAFANHFARSEAARKQLWDACIFVFDTNVLTSLYKRSEEAREALFKIIESLGSRVWIPHQVAYEFLRNRPGVAHEQASMYRATIKSLTDLLSDLESHTKHPFVHSKLHDEFVGVSCKVIEALEDKVSYYENKIVNDDVKERLADLLEGKVGPAWADEKLKKTIKEGEERYANLVPPGYEDVAKHKNSTVFEHVRARYGDLILWLQILEHAKSESTAVILITGDQKDDWWLKVGGKTIGPRPELIAEFKDKVGADFSMYSHSSFLSLANSYLDQRTSESVIKEIEDAALETEDSDVEEVWERVDLVPLDALKDRERKLKAEFDSSAKGFSKLLNELTKASPAAAKDLKRELSERMKTRERLRVELLDCQNAIRRMNVSDFSDLV